MTKDGNGKKQVPKALTIHGSGDQIEEYGKRLKYVLPGGEKLTPFSAVRAADYGKAIDANIFRGEIYAYEDSKGLHIVEGYKLLVRWARRQSDFFDIEEELTDDEKLGRDLDPTEDIAYRVWILREDKLPALEKLANLHKRLGDENAYELARREVAQCGIGVVTLKDRTFWDKKKQQRVPQDPPTGWTWHDVAIKRALKNALNKAYGIPSPKEIAEETWRVGNVETKEEDWEIVEEEMPDASQEQRELLAASLALQREREEENAQLTPEQRQERFKENCELMGQPPEDFEGFDTPEGPPPEQEPPPEENGEEEASKLVADALTPEVIRRVCRYKSKWVKGDEADWSDAVRPDPPPSDPIDDDTLKKVAAALNRAVTGRTQKAKAEKRHEVYQYLYGVSSGKALTVKEGAAILAWIGLPDGKIGDIKALARTEVEGVLRAFQGEAGQQQMELEV